MAKGWVARSRRSDSRAREKNPRRKKKRVETRGVQPNSLPTYHRALLSERLEQTKGWVVDDRIDLKKW